MILWTALASAAPLEDYARRATVALPEAGVVLVEVPPELLDPVFGARETDVLLVDAAGTPVPMARVVAGTEGEQVVAGIAPVGPGTWEIRDLERPADTVVVRLPARRAATVTVYTGAEQISVPTRVWNLGDTSEVDVPLDRPTTANLRVEVVPDPPAGADLLADVAAWTGQAGPRPEVRRLPVVDLGWLDGGAHRYEVAIPPDLPVTAVIFDPEEEIFQRRVGIARGAGDLEPGALYRPYAEFDSEIARSAFGGSRLDHTRVPIAATPGDRLEIGVSGDPPLTFAEVGIEVPGLWVLVRDAGAGPHTLYGAGPAITGNSDLQIAAEELLREAVGRVVAGPAEPNPSWLPPEVGISEPGSPTDLSRMRFERDVVGPEGLVSIPLDNAVLGEARGDLGDVRLVDPSGRAIPFLLRERPGETSGAEVAFERTEAGRQSMLRVRLADPNVPLRSITLVTSANAFARDVAILRPRAARLEPVRAWTWTSQGETSGLTLALYERFGDALVVRIDNGDDAPLPIARIALRYPVWELVAVLPPGGATLVYGDPRALRPEYDLVLVRDQVLRRTPARATLGEARARVEVAPALDRVLAGLGVAVLAGGLLLLVATVLRAVPPLPEP